jgi:hypothetical protein
MISEVVSLDLGILLTALKTLNKFCLLEGDFPKT